MISCIYVTYCFRFEVVRILIEAGVDVDKENRNKWTAVKSAHLDKECKSVILATSKFRQSGKFSFVKS